jgi:hypothetical protein
MIKIVASIKKLNNDKYLLCVEKKMSELLEQAKEIAKEFAEEFPEIDLIIAYGSLAQGRVHELSDIDMIAICDEKKVSWEFVLNERPISIWSMTWEKATKIAQGELDPWCMVTTFITTSKILWSKNDKMKEKFAALDKKLPKSNQKAIKRSIQNFRKVYGTLWLLQENIKNNKVLEVNFLVWDIANVLVSILAELNGHAMQNNWGKQQLEISTFSIIPGDFIERYENLITAKPNKVLSIAKELVDDVHILLKNWLKEHEKDQVEIIDRFVESEWSGVIEYYNKLKSAAGKNDIIAARYAATELSEYLLWAYMILNNRKWERNIFYSTEETLLKLSKKIPQNIETLLTSNNPSFLIEAATQAIKSLEEELIIRGANLPYAENLEEAKQFIFQEERNSEKS